MVQVSLLGPLEVRREGALVPIAGGKTAEVLVRLALDAGTVVRTDRLIEELWADDAVNTRRNTLQSKIAKLRRALGDPPLVLSRDDGYVLDVDPSAIDALAVLAEVDATTQLLEQGDDRRAADLAMGALAQLEGELIPTATGDWAAARRAQLEAARSTLLEAAFAARVRLGADADLVGDLELSLATDPFHERLWELLMTALYRAGRQADALAAYQRARAVLAEQLGLDPGPRLQELERQILAQDQALGDQGDEPDALSTNLPALTTVLVGRDDDVETIGSRIRTERLVTLVGPGGVGKTALAIEAGRRARQGGGFPVGGVWLVRLETASTASEVVDALIAVVGVVGGESALVDRLRANATLVVLDNCEHLVDPVSDLVVRLLDACPGLHVLATSQVALGLDGEAVVELAPLPLADAIDLFARRTETHGRRRSGDDARQVEELCRSLDGLPLAIELAAARTKTLSVSDIARRLDDRFDVLSDPASRRSERRRALRSTISWSYDLLFPDDQKGLWALATFAGGAPLAAAEHVLERLGVPDSAALDVLSRLAGRSLLITDDDEATDSVRYRLLDSIRAFAREAMTDGGMLERAHDAHAEWIAMAAAASTEGVRSGDQARFLALAASERANIDAALAWSAEHDPPRALAIAIGFGWAWIVLGDSRGAQRLLTALAAVDGASDRDQATALLLAAWIEASLGELDAAHAHLVTAHVAAEATSDVELQARIAYHEAYVVSHQGQWERALELTARSAAGFDALDHPWDQAANALFAARAATSAGDAPRAAAACASVRRWLEVVDDPWLHVRAEAAEGERARLEHRFDDAVEHLRRATHTSARRGFRQTEAYQRSSLGRALCQAGDYPAGAATLELALAHAEAIGDVRLAALIRVHLGRVLRATGQLDGARTALTAAATWHRTVGGGEQSALGECLLAALDARDGAPDARDRLMAALDDAQRRADVPVEVFALDALARIAADEGDDERALELQAAADLCMSDASHFISEIDRVDAVRPST